MGSDQEMKHSLKFSFFREATFEAEPCWVLGMSLTSERWKRFAKERNRFQFRLLFSLKNSPNLICDPVSRDNNEMQSKYGLNVKRECKKYHCGFLIYSLPRYAAEQNMI